MMQLQQISPIFIIGSYRSGTSITTWCLGQHPNIWLLPETYWISQFAESLETLYAKGTAQPAAHFTRCGVTEEDFHGEAAEFVDRVVRRGQERRMRRIATSLSRGGQHPSNMQLQRGPFEPKARWVDGTPENSHYVGALLKLFPLAKFIHLVRSPHEVVRSLGKFDAAGGEAQQAEEGYTTWRRLAGASYEAEQEFGSEIVRRFFHADLVDRPKKTLRSMLEFAGESFADQCLEPLLERINSSMVEDEAVMTVDSVSKKLAKTFESNQAYFDMLRSSAKM